MKILEELFYGNISINEKTIDENSELKKMMDLVCKNEEKLTSVLFDEQNELFEKYKNSFIEMTTINERDVFKSGFSLGSRITYETMNNEDFVI